MQVKVVVGNLRKWLLPTLFLKRKKLVTKNWGPREGRLYARVWSTSVTPFLGSLERCVLEMHLAQFQKLSVQMLKDLARMSCREFKTKSCSKELTCVCVCVLE